MTHEPALPQPAAKPRPKAVALSVGWTLTAITLFVLASGVMIVRRVSHDWRPTPEYSQPSVLPVEPLPQAQIEPAQAEPLVLKPVQSGGTPWRAEQAERDPQESRLLR